MKGDSETKRFLGTVTSGVQPVRSRRGREEASLYVTGTRAVRKETRDPEYVFVLLGKVKGNAYARTGHESPEEE